MSYRFEHAESADDGIRRIVVEQLDDAIQRLTDGLSEDPEKSVHEARKDMKKARSAMRLVRFSLGRKRYRRDNDKLRSAGRGLSLARDAAVKQETLAALADHYGDDLSTDAKQAIADATVAVQSQTFDVAQLEPAAAEAAVTLRAVRDDVMHEWQLDESGWDALEPGVDRAYRRGRKLLDQLHDDPSDETVHAFRKRAKDLWYHQRLLRDCWTEPMKASIDQLHDLTDLVGDHHDLAVLEADLGTDLALTIAERDALAQTIAKRKDELLEQALDLATRVYAEKPGAYGRRMRALWRAWRAPSGPPVGAAP